MRALTVTVARLARPEGAMVDAKREEPRPGPRLAPGLDELERSVEAGEPPGCAGAAATCDAGQLARELARLREVERAVLEFCERCERGEIRSDKTYRRFRAALAGVADAAT